MKRFNAADYVGFNKKGLLFIIIKNQIQMSKELDDLTQEVSETKTVMESAKVLIDGFAARLEAAGTDKTKLAALKSDLDAGSQSLAASVAANTAASEETPATDTPDGEPV